MPFREVVVAPTEAVTGAWENNDIWSLYDALITFASHWPDMAPKPGQPCPIQFTEEEIETNKYESHMVQAISKWIHHLHNDNLVPLGGAVYRERYEATVAINKKCHEAFIDLGETEKQKDVASRAWPYQDRP